ncbi:MAG: hypothetical protein IKN12_12705 [Selenomonadaceae bacterium]|nr:hypothetical protein [Selenomonadaceae bacterium]
MSTMERFQAVVKEGALPGELGGASLTAQAKYDFLAAYHSMEQLTAVIEAIEKRKKKRENLKEKILSTAKKSLTQLLEGEFSSVKDVDKAAEMLNACRKELITLEAEAASDKAIGKLVQDGVSAGR